MIEKTLLKEFYNVYEIPNIERPKYFGFFEILDGKCYPKITPEIFIKILNVLWKEQIDMNVDNEPDLETLIHYRNMTYQDRVIQEMTESFPIRLENDIFEHIRYEVQQIFKGVY